MELALLLIFLVIVELVFTVWFLARQRDVRKNEKVIVERVKRLEKNVTKLAEVLQDMSYDVSGPQEDYQSNASLADLVAQATPEDIAKAQSILKSFGMEE